MRVGAGGLSAGGESRERREDEEEAAAVAWRPGGCPVERRPDPGERSGETTSDRARSSPHESNGMEPRRSRPRQRWRTSCRARML
jgi:hypothetical protein